jgi:gas vesicle protein GvpO
MAESTRSESRQQRSDAREQRRSLAAKPFEQLDEAADAEERGGGSRSSLRQAAKTALAGALLAGVAGAVKGLADRRGDEPAAEDDSDENPSEPADAEPQAEAQDEQPENREQEDPQAQAAPEDDAEEDEPQSSRDAETDTEREEPQAQAAPEDDAEEDEPQSSGEAETETETEREEPQERADDASAGAPRGASSDEVKEIVDEAKRELQELLGAEPERVSGFDHSDGRWTVTLEVVNVRRIPDTTDVLSSYEVAFDDDHNLVSVSETRRYRRSQVEEG